MAKQTRKRPSNNERDSDEYIAKRPLTRRFLKEQKAQETVEGEPRRSKRDHQSIRIKRNSCGFEGRLYTLFFEPRETREGWKTVGDYARLQLRRVHSPPTSIYEIDGFLSEPELNYFQDFIQKCLFKKSFVDNMQFGENDEMSPNKKRQRRTILDDTHRTSTFYGFKHRADNTIRAIEQRVAALLGCWVHQIEGLQLVRYFPGQFFGVHHDLGDLREDGTVILPKKDIIVKRRLVTIFVYLNDLTDGQGGCTYFPNCNNLRVQPKRGKAVLWSNIRHDGFPDPNTIHAGETVRGDQKVVKYGLNIWVTEE